MQPQPATTSVASAAQPVRSKGERFHQLDGLRALAASLVILHHMLTASLGISLAAKGYHFAANAIATTTASGVDLFFVLSGALLLRPYLRGNRPMKPTKYLMGRVRRLWPPYLAAWVLAGVVILATTRFPTWWTSGADLPAFHWSNWVAQLGIVYVGDHPYSFAWWSLSVEVLFYLLVPLIISLLIRANLSRTQMAAALLGAIVLAVLATNMRSGVIPATLWPLVRFCTYVSCFTAGVILARFDCPDRWAWRALSVGVPYCILAFRFPRMDVHVGWGLIYFGIVILALNGATRLKRWLSTWLLVWIGERSYSLFLIHYSVITAVCLLVSLFTAQKGARYFLTTRLLELPLTLMAAMLLFHFVERRFAKNLATGDYFWPTLVEPQSKTSAIAPAPALLLAEESLSVVTP